MKVEYVFGIFDFGVFVKNKKSYYYIYLFKLLKDYLEDDMNKIKLVLFDMDGTLLKERGIFEIAKKKKFVKKLEVLINDKNLDFHERSIEIAKLSRGLDKNDLLKIFRKITLNDNVEYVIKEIKKKGIYTAIVTDSYLFLAEDLKNRLDIDYVFANNLIIDNNIITGEIKIHNKELKRDFYSGEIYSICKSCVLEDLCKKLNINTNDTIAIGDGKVDIGMLKKAGIGIAFNAAVEVQKNADIVTSDMKKILEYI